MATVLYFAQFFWVNFFEQTYPRETVKGIDSVLQVLLDTYRESSNLSLVPCGSYVEVMKSLLEKDNPLYGRLVRACWGMCSTRPSSAPRR